ncbi:putative RNA recognition motif domain, nucleotide-binding alpha-beta plait domain superfamily [Dioscorea sansibarensis]
MTLSSTVVIPTLTFSPSRPSSIPPWLPLRSPFNQVLILKNRNHSVLLPLHCSMNSQSSPTPEAAASPSSRIFIKGLSHSTSEGSLAKAFSSFGEVKRVKIILSKGSKQSLGFAYIWFACEEDARLSVSEMDGKFFEGRFISVVIAHPESPTKQVRAVPYRF